MIPHNDPLRNLRAQELVGLGATIIQSTNPTLIGQTGFIVAETKNTLILDVNGRLKMIPKSVVTPKLYLPGGITAILPGSELLGRPEERIAKMR